MALAMVFRVRTQRAARACGGCCFPVASGRGATAPSPPWAARGATASPGPPLRYRPCRQKGRPGRGHRRLRPPWTGPHEACRRRCVGRNRQRGRRRCSGPAGRHCASAAVTHDVAFSLNPDEASERLLFLHGADPPARVHQAQLSRRYQFFGFFGWDEPCESRMMHAHGSPHLGCQEFKMQRWCLISDVGHAARS